MARDFITLLGMVHILKLVNCLFWNFPFNIFAPQVTETTENETMDKVELLCISFQNFLYMQKEAFKKPNLVIQYVL